MFILDHLVRNLLGILLVLSFPLQSLSGNGIISLMKEFRLGPLFKLSRLIDWLAAFIALFPSLYILYIDSSFSKFLWNYFANFSSIEPVHLMSFVLLLWKLKSTCFISWTTSCRLGRLVFEAHLRLNSFNLSFVIKFRIDVYLPFVSSWCVW